jgi:acyl-ACP thioesterase
MKHEDHNCMVFKGKRNLKTWNMMARNSWCLMNYFFFKAHTHTHTKHEACKCIENNQHCPRDAVVGQAA